MSQQFCESKHSGPKPTPEQRVADSLTAAILLAFCGGVLDAFLYVGHGKVFAGAMTGNAILCGIALLGRRWPEILHHALPIAAFLCGVSISEVLQRRLEHHAITVGLALEAVGLLTASFLPGGFPGSAFIFFIVLLAAFQIASFRTADSYSYNSTFITGDLRTFLAGVYKLGRHDTRAEGARQARDLGSIIVSFILGALAGAILTPRWGNHALWLPVLAVLIVFVMALRRSVEHERQS